jgi:hypothetical protein
MANPEIKPRIDDEDVPWCDEKCPEIVGLPSVGLYCDVDGWGRNDQVCPHYVKRMAAENKTLLKFIDLLISVCEDGGDMPVSAALSCNGFDEIRALLRGD